MPVYFLTEDESNKLGQKQFILSKPAEKALQQSKNYFGKKASQKPGFKRLMALTDKSYNKRSDKKDRQHNNNNTVSFYDLKRIERDMSGMDRKGEEFAMLGGETFYRWAKNTLQTARNGVKKVPEVPEVPKLDKRPTTPPNVKDTAKVDGIEVTVEGILSEKEFEKLLKG